MSPEARGLRPWSIKKICANTKLFAFGDLHILAHHKAAQTVVDRNIIARVVDDWTPQEKASKIVVLAHPPEFKYRVNLLFVSLASSPHTIATRARSAVWSVARDSGSRRKRSETHANK